MLFTTRVAIRTTPVYLDGDATGEDDAPEAGNHWAGGVQLVPVHDTILGALVDLPEPTKQRIQSTLETF